MADKLDMKSMNKIDDNIKKIGALFPNCVTERKNADGEVEYAIDFDMLKQELSDIVVEGKEERYQFTWPDKKKSILAANAPISDTLRPCREESVDFDNTQNLYIEGDNLAVLKLLQETYLGKIKMIYIDPPYNTGNDFVYNDDFAESVEEYLAHSGQFDEDGDRLVTNTESNGRFHTDWLNMMYPRLKIAKDLLTEDGVIFVHIDDNEVENLGKLCNDVFGEDNFINVITVKTKIGGVSGSSEGKSLKDVTEFIWVYAKNKNELLLNPVYNHIPLFDRIQSYLDEGKSWKYTSIITKLDGKVLLKRDEKHDMNFYGYTTLETQSISSYAKANGLTEQDVYNRYADRIFRTTNAQSSVRQTVIRETKGFDYPMYSCEYAPIKGRNEGQLLEVLYKSGATDDQRNMVMFLSDVVKKIDGVYYYLDKISSLWDDIDYNNLTKEGNIEFANGKKPIKLLQRIINLATNEDSYVLDFFSGSASTAHAVIQQNLEDNGNRKFIMVQLPEETDAKSEVYKAGYKNICEIGKERIRRAGAKIKEENGMVAQNLDTGFRVLKLDSSNMKDVYYTPDEYTGDLLSSLADNIKEDRTPEDLLFQVMLDLGVLLSSKIEEDVICGKKVFNVADGFLYACFDSNVSEKTITAIAKKKPYYFVMRDSSMATDSVATNFDQIFATYSPETERKVL